jgi:hypothetical protein
VLQIGAGPDADRHDKLLIYLALEGAHFSTYSQQWAMVMEGTVSSCVFMDIGYSTEMWKLT